MNLKELNIIQGIISHHMKIGLIQIEMKKIVHGIRHEMMSGISVAYIIEQIKPVKVLVEAQDKEDFNRGDDGMDAIAETCERLGIPIIPMDKKRTIKHDLMGIVFIFFDGVFYIMTTLLRVLLFPIKRVSSLQFYNLQISFSRYIPFINYVDDEREEHFIKVIRREDIGEGLMYIVVGLGHVKSILRQLNNRKAKKQ